MSKEKHVPFFKTGKLLRDRPERESLMRYIRYACIAVFAIALVAVALANRGHVMIQLLPTEIAHLFAVAPTVELPLFVVIFGGVLIGLLVGFIWEWMREYAVRAENARNAREVRRLEREVKTPEVRKASRHRTKCWPCWTRRAKRR